jgi:hypothetical protein
MSSINGSQALSILGGSEGAVDNSVDLPVSKELLGKSRGKNKSGFSFGGRIELAGTVAGFVGFIIFLVVLLVGSLLIRLAV